MTHIKTLQDDRPIPIGMLQFICELVQRQKPKSLVETGGWHGEFTLPIAQLLQNYGGQMLSLECYRPACDLLKKKIQASGLNNVEAKWEESPHFYSAASYDFALLNPDFPDREEEFYHIMGYLNPGATVVLTGYHEGLPLMQNLPQRLQKAGLLRGDFVHDLFVGTYIPALRKLPQRVVFCLSAGRSGTTFLTNVLQGLDGVVSLHEPEPRYQWHSLQLQTDKEAATRFLAEQKLPWLATIPCHTYIESSHYISKGYLESWLQSPLLPDLIVMNRDARAVAKSWYALGVDFHHKKEYAMQHMLHPEDRRRLFLTLDQWENYSDYQLCYWYALESERRKRYYAQLFAKSGARIFELSLDDLKSGAALNDLLDWLQTGSENERVIINNRLNKIVNDKTHMKDKARMESLNTMDLNALEQQVREHVCEVL